MQFFGMIHDQHSCDGFQRKAIELMNNVNEIIKYTDLRKVVFGNRVHIMFVAYTLFKKHFSKNTTKILQ